MVMNKKKILYMDTCALINLKNVDMNISNKIAMKYDVYLSLLNMFEIIVYKNTKDKIQLLKFIEILKKYSLLDLPTSIIKRFLYDFSMHNTKTLWSITKESNPDWNDSNNILIIKDFLKHEDFYIINEI